MTRLEFVRASIRDAISKADTPEQASVRLAQWRESLAGDDRIVRAIYEPSVQADLGGQAFVRLVELEDDTRLLAVDVRPAFLDLPFEEAIAFWRARGGSREQLESVLRSYRKQAAGASELFLDAISRRAVDELTRAFEAGVSIQEFAQSINDEAQNFGLGPVKPSYLETVFRTNVAVAYGAGRYRQLTDPVVVAARPFRQYRTAGDGRVRSSHAALDGLIFDAQDAQWKQIAPPNGFNCRCAMVSLSRAQYLEMGGTTASSLPAEFVPDPDFDGAPTDML